MADRRRRATARDGGAPPAPPAPHRAAGAIGWLAALVVALALYGATMAPDLVWHDAGDYQWRAANLQLVRPGDAVRVHPLYLVIAHGLGRVGLWTYAQGATVASVIGTAILVANVYLATYLLTRRAAAAAMAGLACLVSHTIWQVGVQPQTYGWSNAMLSGMLVAAIAYAQGGRSAYLVLGCVLGGLGLSVHLLSQLGLAVLAVWVLVRVARRQTPAWVIPAGAAAWLISGALFWYVAWMEYRHSGSVGGALASAFIGRWGGAVFNVAGMPQMVLRSALMLVLNFPTPVLLVGAWGLWRSRRFLSGTPWAALLAAMLAVYALFALRYRVPQQHFFFTPAYLLVAMYVGIGFASARWSRKGWATAVVAALLVAVVPTYRAMAAVARAWQVDLRGDARGRPIPYRDFYAYSLEPWQHTQTGPRRFAEETLEALPPGAVLFADSTVRPPLLCVHALEGRRPDVRLATRDGLPADVVRRYWGSEADLLPEFRAEGRRVFVVSGHPAYMPAWMARHTRRVPFGLVYEAVEPAGPAPAGGAP